MNLVTYEWVAYHFHDHINPEIWSYRSPDLNPLDYYTRNVVERNVIERAHSTKYSLKAAILRVMSNRNQRFLIRKCR